MEPRPPAVLPAPLWHPKINHVHQCVSVPVFETLYAFKHCMGPWARANLVFPALWQHDSSSIKTAELHDWPWYQHPFDCWGFKLWQASRPWARRRSDTTEGLLHHPYLTSNAGNISAFIGVSEDFSPLMSIKEFRICLDWINKHCSFCWFDCGCTSLCGSGCLCHSVHQVSFQIDLSHCAAELLS